MKKRATIKVTIYMVLGVALLFMGAIAKLCYVVLSDKVDGINLQDKSASITTVEKTLYSSRGNIYDVNGEELASTVNSYKIIAMLSPSRTTDLEHPRHIVDKAGTASQLAPILEVSEEYLLKLFNKNVYQTELGTAGRDISEVTKAKIEQLELPGIEFVSNSKKRYYSQGTKASYIVGYAKKNDDGELVGELGIEGYYDDLLTGNNGYTKYLKYTKSNYQIPNTPEERKEAIDGSDIYLTIDTKIQMIAEDAVKTLKSEYDSEWAIFTVMDANTGAIVASATNPNFNPNDTNTLLESGYMNPLVSNQYEPGSVMKIFSFASAVDSGNFDGTATYKSGAVELKDGTVIRDAERKGWGVITFDEGFARSSNVAATYLAQKVGVEKLTDYYTDLGFGSKTGVELSNEVSGEIDFLYESELATASFGQGVTVTPIQMLQALSSMTNDGTALKPYIVDKIVDSNGNVTYEGKRTVVKKVFSTNTVNKMHELMHAVVYGPGNGVRWGTTWQVDNVSIMGKTGTAQIASPSGGYQTGEYDYIKSFAGIFPEENPKYIAYVVAKKLKTSTSIGWAKIVTKAISQIASYAKIAEVKSDVDPTKLIIIDNYLSKDLNTVMNNLNNKKLNVITLGSGKYITNQYPNKNTTVLSNSKLFLVTNNSDYQMIDLSNWSLNEVKTYCNLIGLRLEYTGYGYVASQSIPAGTIIDPVTNVLTVELVSR